MARPFHSIIHSADGGAFYAILGEKRDAESAITSGVETEIDAIVDGQVEFLPPPWRTLPKYGHERPLST